MNLVDRVVELERKVRDLEEDQKIQDYQIDSCADFLRKEEEEQEAYDKRIDRRIATLVRVTFVLLVYFIGVLIGSLL